MFALTRRLKNHNKTDSAPAEEETPRIAISEEGRIVYASDGFHALSALNAQQTHNAPADKIIKFADYQHDINALPAGMHKILIGSGAAPMIFHFDWLEMPDNKRYLIASHATENKNSRALMKAFKSKIIKNDNHAEAQQKFAIEKHEDLYRFAQMTQELMIITDANGHILNANQTFLSTLGYSEASMAGASFSDLLHEDDRAHNSPYFEARMIAKDGNIRWIEWQYQNQGNRRYYCGRDITAIKEQHNAIKRRETQLSEAESIGRMGHWSWIIGQGTITWSDEIYRIFGVTRDEFSPTMHSMNAMVHRHDIDLIDHALQRAIISQNDFDVEFRIIQQSGEERFIRCEGRCLNNDEGEAIELYGIMQDMTERMLYESELKEAKDSAERAYNAKSQFLANMSHELRTPLNAIIGFSEMIHGQLLGPVGNEKYLEYVDSIRDSGAHLLDLISDILDMSKIEAGKYELILEKFRIANVIKRAADMMQSRALDHNIHLSVSGLPDPEFKIVADRRASLQIILNLLSNAIKFSKDNGKVELNCITGENDITITVRDEGIGIPANKLANIMRPFEQVSASYTREHEGSGLGLAITKELIELHGGSIKIDSQIDVGTQVTIKLPINAAKDTPIST